MTVNGNVLLVTRTPPGDGSVGAIVLREELRLFPKGRVCCFAVADENNSTNARELDGVPIEYSGRVSRSGVNKGVPFVDTFLTFCKHTFHRMVTSRRLAGKIACFGRDNGVSAVWANLNDPIMVYMATKISKALDCPLYTMVWDPPERFMEHMDTVSARLLARDFADAIRTSVRCAVISDEMKKLYEKEYGTRAVVVRYGTRRSGNESTLPGLSAGRVLNIGFAGSMYARTSSNAFLDALDSVNWHVGGRRVRIHYFGSDLILKGIKQPADVRYLGWRPEAEVVEALSRTDLLYLPYMFDGKDDMRARLSFPTKLSTYLSARRPIFYHGPEYSAPARFLQNYRAGLCCYSLLAADIAAALAMIVDDGVHYSAMVSEADRAFRNEISVDAFHSNFCEFIVNDVESSSPACARS